MQWCISNLISLNIYTLQSMGSWRSVVPTMKQAIKDETNNKKYKKTKKLTNAMCYAICYQPLFGTCVIVWKHTNAC